MKKILLAQILIFSVVLSSSSYSLLFDGFDLPSSINQTSSDFDTNYEESPSLFLAAEQEIDLPLEYLLSVPSYQYSNIFLDTEEPFTNKQFLTTILDSVVDSFIVMLHELSEEKPLEETPFLPLFRDSVYGLYMGTQATGFGLTALIMGDEWKMIEDEGINVKEEVKNILRTIREIQKNQDEENYGRPLDEFIEENKDRFEKRVKELIEEWEIANIGSKTTEEREEQEKILRAKAYMEFELEFLTNEYLKNGENLYRAERSEFTGSDEEFMKVFLRKYSPAWKYGRWGFLYRYYREPERGEGNLPVRVALGPHGKSLTNDLSTIDFSILAAGVLLAEAYFSSDEEIKNLCGEIFENVEWDKMLDRSKNSFYMGWLPERIGGNFHFLELWWDKYTDETLLINLLGIASGKVDEDTYRGFNVQTEAGYKGMQYVKTPEKSLFQFHMDIWTDKRNLIDKIKGGELGGKFAKGISWFQNRLLATLTNREWSIEHAINANPENDPYATLGANSWPITTVRMPDGTYRMDLGFDELKYDINGDDKYDPLEGDYHVEAPNGYGGSITDSLYSLMGLKNIMLMYPKTFGKYGPLAFSLDVSHGEDGFYWSNDWVGFSQGMFLQLFNLLGDMEQGKRSIWEIFEQNPYVNRELMKEIGYEEIKAKTPDLPQMPDLPQDVDSPKQALEYAKQYMDYVHDLGQIATGRNYIDKQDSTVFDALRQYILTADEAQLNVLSLIEQVDINSASPEIATKLLAIKFAIHKNMLQYATQRQDFYYLVQKFNEFKDVLSVDGITPADLEKLREIAGIIYKYDYEGELTKAITEEQVYQDLVSPSVNSRTATYPFIENEVIGEDSMSFVYPEEVGKISFFTELFSTEHIAQHGFNKIYTEYTILKTLEPFVARCLLDKKEIDWDNPKEVGFLSGYAAEVEGSLEIKRIGGEWRVIGDSKRAEFDMPTEIKRIKLAGRLLKVANRGYGAKLDLVNNKYHKDTVFGKPFTQIWLDIVGYLRGRSLWEVIHNGQENSVGSITRSDYVWPVNYLVANRDFSDEQINHGVSYEGRPAIKIIYNEGENGLRIPLLFGDFSAANWLEFMVKAKDGENVSFNLIIKTKDGKEAVFPVKNVTDDWRRVRIPIWAPYRVDWMEDSGDEEYWLYNDIWKGLLQGTIKTGHWLSPRRAGREIIEGDYWYWRQIAQNLFGIEKVNKEDIELNERNDTQYELSYKGETINIKDEISEYGNWDNIAEIRFEFEPGTEFYISGRHLEWERRDFVGFYRQVGSEYVDSFEKLRKYLPDLDLLNPRDQVMVELPKPILIEAKDGRPLIIAGVEWATPNAYAIVDFIDPSRGPRLLKKSYKEFEEEIWDGGEIIWLE